jgi:hypothetical protein
MENSVGIPQSLGNATRETWIVERPGREEMFKAGVEWADAHPHWIRVDEQKPPVDEPLLLAVNGFGNAQFGQYYRDGIFRNLETYEYANKVTHWKLFPELPRGRE